MRDDYVDITIVLDRSGSMGSIAADVVGGFNNFIDEQKREPGLLRVSMTQFNTYYDIVYNGVPVQEVRPLEFHPFGNTALLDAIGRSINETGRRLAAMDEHDRPRKVIFVIMTDGQENSSREFTKAKIKEMINHQTDKYGWTFVFMGAKQDSFHEAGGLGFRAGSTINYADNAQGVKAAYMGMSSKLSAVRCKSAGSEQLTSGQFYNADDYAVQTAAGADNSKATSATTTTTGHCCQK